MKEYKIVEIGPNLRKKDYTYAEAVMNTEAADGWEVVSAAFDVCRDIRGVMVITFVREKERPV